MITRFIHLALAIAFVIPAALYSQCVYPVSLAERINGAHTLLFGKLS
jgi:hypothetical protein